MSAFIDQFFGTFREKLGTSKAYKGEWKSAADNVVDAAHEKTEAVVTEKVGVVMRGCVRVWDRYTCHFHNVIRENHDW